MLKIIVLLIVLSIYSIQCWEALPQIPTGRRSQYLVLHENGEYKYGYDTGDGSAAEQSGDASNQVEGRYLYNSPSGQKLNIKYTAGIQGFVPEGIPQASPSPSIPPAAPILRQYSNLQHDNDDQTGISDASYAFNIDTDSYKRQETSDARGNVKGSYSYNNEAGAHDLTYVAGENTGFVAVSRSLATPNALEGSSSSQGYNYNHPTARSGSSPAFPSSSSSTPNADGSYSFSYSTSDASQQQSGDANGNVKGSYSYSNSAGIHDLTYIAGSETGFVATGGSLSQPNGLSTQPAGAIPNSETPFSGRSQHAYSSSLTPIDGSYRFEYSSEDSSRKEIGDTSGNIQGSYSYRNQAGNHDLSYIAGSATGFQVTGGSLSVPNGLGSSSPSILTPTFYGNPQATSSVSTYSPPEQNDLANTGDSSYSFNIDTGDYKRTETSDGSGNVQGSFSYRNSAGAHDLSFVAGSGTGFLPTGGSLSNPNTILKSPSYKSISPPVSLPSNDNEQSAGDASYNFSIDTDQYKRTESSDANGNVVGSFSYKNSLGQHDLSYQAGAEQGFKTTGGSLSTPPGLNEIQLRSGGFNSQSSYTNTPVTSYSSEPNPVLPSTKNTYRIGNVVVNSYLPPINDKRKFGYIFDTKY